MEETFLSRLKEQSSRWLDTVTLDSKHLLWKFFLYYLLKKERQLKRNQIGEIQDFLSYYEIPEGDFQNLDEEITTFLLGYRILQLCRKATPYNDKVKKIKEKLEKDWNSQYKKYFNNDILTLIILLSDSKNLHRNEVILEDNQPQELIFIPLFFLILEDFQNLRSIYDTCLKRTMEEPENIRESEKIYIAWMLWKYRQLSKQNIKEIRKTVSSYIDSLNNEISEEFKEGNLNMNAVFAYDLLYNFERKTRIAFEEVPTIFRILSWIFGVELIIGSIFCGWWLHSRSFLTHKQQIPLDTLIKNRLINAFVVIILMLVVYVGIFLIYKIGIQAICTNKQVKNELKEWLVNKYIWGFVIGTLFLGFITKFI